MQLLKILVLVFAWFLLVDNFIRIGSKIFNLSFTKGEHYYIGISVSIALVILRFFW